VPRLGKKAYEQAAGFLRIMNGDNPLDASSVHPEAYPVIKDIVKKTGTTITDLIGKQRRGINIDTDGIDTVFDYGIQTSR
jgi:uncharacterized protein